MGRRPAVGKTKRATILAGKAGRGKLPDGVHSPAAMTSDLLFEVPYRFRGLPAGGFRAFAVRDRAARRRAIVDAFHPPLRLLGEDLIERLPSRAPLHAHLPRLDWPAGYQPFCTWLALSRAPQGYQAEMQLNVGVHADHVSIRLAWDTSAAGFGRFEFLCLNGGLGGELRGLAQGMGLGIRVFAAAEWPVGSRLVFESPDDLAGAFREVERRGVWFEVGERHPLLDALPVVTGPRLADRALSVFSGLLPFYERIASA